MWRMLCSCHKKARRCRALEAGVQRHRSRCQQRPRALGGALPLQRHRTHGAATSSTAPSPSHPTGLIATHRDRFNFWRWARQALGAPGVLLGWSPSLKRKVRNTAAGNFEEVSGASLNLHQLANTTHAQGGAMRGRKANAIAAQSPTKRRWSWHCDGVPLHGLPAHSGSAFRTNIPAPAAGLSAHPRHTPHVHQDGGQRLNRRGAGLLRRLREAHCMPARRTICRPIPAARNHHAKARAGHAAAPDLDAAPPCVGHLPEDIDTFDGQP